MTNLESSENYLEAILILKNKNGVVKAIDIVNMLEFSKPSVSIAMKKLRESGHITVDAENHIELTKTGRIVAEKVYDRHRLICLALKQIGVPDDIAAVDACRIEHIVSEETIVALRKYTEK